MKDYPYKTEPRGKQREVIEGTWDRQCLAYLCRPGTGKTKIGLDQAGMNYLADRIDALLVFAPEGVDRQWIEEGVPKHLSDSVPRQCYNYTSGMGKLAFAVLEKAVSLHPRRSPRSPLLIVTMTFDGLQTPRGKKIASALVTRFRTMCIDDESHRTSNMKSGVYKAVKPVMRAARVRRIGTGTLIRQNPFSAYGQFELMGDALLGFASLASFKSTYAEMLPPDNGLVWAVAQKLNRRDKQGKLIAPNVIAKDADGRPRYRNLNDLRRRLDRHAVFLTLADVNGKEPVVNETPRYVHLTKEQRAMYDDLVRYGVAQAPGGQLTAEGSLALSIRQAQVAGGFAPCDDDWSAQPIPGGNPKLEELLALADELGGEKFVVWCKFTPEIVALVAALREVYGNSAVTEYHGRMTGAQKDASKRSFIDDKGCKFFVGQQKAGGTGLDGLQAVSQYMAFYSNDYPYLERLQAISRLARTGGSETVQVWDIIAQHTIDEDIVATLKTAQDVSEAVLQRAVVRRWN
jgi:hypothetical protein